MTAKIVKLEPKETDKDYLIRKAIEIADTVAEVKRIKYEAYLAQGFTEAQALELCKD